MTLLCVCCLFSGCPFGLIAGTDESMIPNNLGIDQNQWIEFMGDFPEAIYAVEYIQFFAEAGKGNGRTEEVELLKPSIQELINLAQSKYEVALALEDSLSSVADFFLNSNQNRNREIGRYLRNNSMLWRSMGNGYANRGLNDLKSGKATISELLDMMRDKADFIEKFKSENEAILELGNNPSASSMKTNSDL